MAKARGIIAVDKMGTKVLFLNPVTYATEVVLDGFDKTVHELLVVPETSRAYVPIFGDGIHGRNPNPQHWLCVFDLEKRALLTTIDLRPYIAPHTLKLGSDGFIYITCENSAKVVVIDPRPNRVVEALDSGSTNGHRLVIAPDGQRLYTENEEDGTVSVIDLAERRLMGKIKCPRPLAGIAISANGKTVIAVDDAEPKLILIDTEAGYVREELVLKDVPKAAQIARYSPDNKTLGVTSLNSDTVSLIDPSFKQQTAIKVGSQPMDMAFHGDELFVACQGDGSVHVIDIANKKHKSSFKARQGLRVDRVLLGSASKGVLSSCDGRCNGLLSLFSRSPRCMILWRRKIFRTALSPSWCRSRPVAAWISSPAPSDTNCRSVSANRC